MASDAPTDGTGTGQILDGIRIVDLTQYLAGPTVTRLLAEHGADVVKVEQAPHGDPTRHLAVQREGRSGYFVQQNRGKRSICLDFDDPEGRRILDALVATADVVVENYGPGVLERRGLDHASLRARHPRLIVASISGFGRAPGPLSHKTSFDLIAQAYSGLLALTGPADGPPMPVGASYADVMSGVHAVAGIGLALFHRERTGQGQHVDIAMVDALFHVHELTVQGPYLTGGKWRPRRSGATSALNSPMGVYQGPQGWIVLQVMAAQWPGFCRAMGRPELEHDERFAGLRERQRNRGELNALIEEWMAGFATDAGVLAALEAERVPCAPVLDAADAHEHPYFVERGMVRLVPDPVLGEVRIPGNPLRLSAQPAPPALVAPLLGEHNAEILGERGGPAADAQRLEAAGVLRRTDR
jgi:crotonobetainyl-CoA:carnitine CoA-transferase CaiB-like acyl-CoA transferase